MGLEVHISVFDENGNLHGAEEGIAVATVTPEQPVCQCGPLLATHRLRAVLPNNVPYGIPGIIHIEVPGYETIHQEVTLAQDIGVQLKRNVLAPSRLSTAGQFFQTADGLRFSAIECSDFLLYQRYLNGENIEPILSQRRDIGFNMVRVFGMYNNSAGLGQFIPITYSDAYYSKLTPFYALLARYGLYGEFTANADSRTVFTSAQPQIDNWMRLGTIFPTITNAIVECVNENDQSINTLWADLVRMRSVICSHGSNGSQAAPVRPWWDYETVHLNNAFEWQRKTGHWAYECSNGAQGIAASYIPVIANENTRYLDEDASLNHAYDAAAGAALLCAGSCFHSISGKASQLWLGTELEAAKQWVAGAHSVALTCQPGEYKRIDPPDPYLRIYQRGTADSCIVRIRA